MELANADFNMAIDAEKLDSKFKGLKWISAYYTDQPLKEINLLIDAKKILTTSKGKKIIITDYLFFF